MRIAALFLLVCIPAFSQQAVTPAATPASTASAQASSGPHANAHRVMSTPTLSRPKGLTAASTAQTMAARQPAPLTSLPSFSVGGTDGARHAATSFVPNSSTTPAARWILVYVEEGTRGTDVLLKSFAANQSGPLAQGSRMVVVVLPKTTAGAQAIANVQSAHPLSNATWTHDAAREALGQLKPHGLPAVYAVEGTQIMWQLHGAQADPVRTVGLASDWAGRERPPLTTPATMIAARANADAAAANAGAPK